MTTNEQVPDLTAHILTLAQAGTTATEDVDAILKAGTFQGFTDEQIQHYVDFFVARAAETEVAKSGIAANIMEMNQRIESAEQARQDAHEVFQAKLKRELVLQGVDTSAATDDGVGANG